MNRASPEVARRGFTLMELLVVVAIIMLLIALLMPALRGAREHAGQIACVANLRQYSVALINYTADYQGYYPMLYGFGRNWHNRLEPYLGKAVYTLRCPSNKGVPKNAYGYAPVAIGGGVGWQDRPCDGMGYGNHKFERMGMRFRAKLAMGGVDYYKFNSACGGELIFDYWITEEMHPPDPLATYVMEVIGNNHWTSAAGYPQDFLATPHRGRSNYLSAGLGIVNIDFNGVSESDFSFWASGDYGAWYWYRVRTGEWKSNFAWPWRTQKVISSPIFQ